MPFFFGGGGGENGGTNLVFIFIGLNLLFKYKIYDRNCTSILRRPQLGKPLETSNLGCALMLIWPSLDISKQQQINA